ncbi:hypothetical protein ATY81_12350 [Rhizobium sp. R72]|uniref:hypothetical protein n=1 Tax=unclassified Rhizobium TaxID=2613769 RepID=UPI000B532D97|nr:MULTISPECIES: hypothetical protein [unclassified Rhizobium]OWV94236.1 hypothetical protein ATY81_12350 [Rhizobium sp. R72]OWV94506.1 hypothetical protein ATY80_12350 [Rhizobium sp. R711]
MRAHNAKLPGKEILAQLIERGVSREDIAKRYAVSRDHVTATLKAHGLAPEREPTLLDLFERKSFEADLRAGLNLKQIDKKYGANPGAARRFALANNIDLVRPGIQIKEDRIVYGRRANSKTGGLAFMAVSVPRVSMLVAHLETPL